MGLLKVSDHTQAARYILPVDQWMEVVNKGFWPVTMRQYISILYPDKFYVLYRKLQSLVGLRGKRLY